MDILIAIDRENEGLEGILVKYLPVGSTGELPVND